MARVKPMRRSIAPWWVFPCAAAFLALLRAARLLRHPAARLRGHRAGVHGGRPGLRGEGGRRPARPRRAPASASATGSSRPTGTRSTPRATGRPCRPTSHSAGRSRSKSSADGGTFGAEWVVTPAGLDYWRRREGIDLLVTRLVQFITLVLGLVVVFRRPFDAGARLGGWLLATFGVFCIALPYRIADVWRGLPLWAGAALWLPLASTLRACRRCCCRSSSASRGGRSGRRRPGSAIWTPAALIAAAHLRFLGSVVYRPAAERLPADWFGWRWGGWIGYLGAAAIVAFVKYRRADPVERRRLGVLLLGGGIGAVAGGPIALAYWRGSETTLFASPAIGAGHARPPGGSAVVRLRDAPPPGVRRQLHHPPGRPVRPGPPAAALGRARPCSAWWRRTSTGTATGRSASSSARARRSTRARRARPRRDAAASVAGSTRSTAGSSASATTPGGCCTAWSKRCGGRGASSARPPLRRGADRARAAPAVRDRAGAGARCPTPTGPWRRRRLGRTRRAAGRREALRAGPRARASRSTCRRPAPRGSPSVCRRKRRLVVDRLGLELLVPVDTGSGRPDADAGARRAPVRGAVRQRGPAAALDDRREPGGARPAGPERRCTRLGVPGVPDLRHVLRLRHVDVQRGCGAAHRRGACPASSPDATGWSSASAAAGMGVVYAAVRPVARPQRGGQGAARGAGRRPESAARFEHEARIAASFSHPNVVTVHDFGVIGDSRAFLVMERLEGTTLRDELGRGPARCRRACWPSCAASAGRSRRRTAASSSTAT